MKIDEVHRRVLKKFNTLKGETLKGQAPIKGLKKGELVPPDEYVSEDHMLHGLIRGFYKPTKKQYLLSYQATELKDNYGEQIRWIDKEVYSYELIEMRPPDSLGDSRKKSDINAARYNMKYKIPIGILLRVSNGINVVLGLGIIIDERKNGVFIVKPHEKMIQEEISYIRNITNEYETPEGILTD